MSNQPTPTRFALPRQRSAERNPSPALPAAVAATLVRAHRAEADSVGPGRRPAFRRTRALIAGARSVGLSLNAIAELLGTSVGSVRDRSADEGRLDADDIIDLTGVEPAALARWRELGRLPDPAVDPDGRYRYRAEDVVRALCWLDEEPT